jgi:hypothetical protein
MDSYDFQSKHLYRSRRESAIDRMLSKPKALRTVAYLDTGEALDTISYLRRGYKPEHLWAINNNPAEVAHLSMTLKREGLPMVNTIGLDFEDALTRRVPMVDVVDFDGMSCLHDAVVFMLSRVVKSRPSAIFGFTLLGGREHFTTNIPAPDDRNGDEFWRTNYRVHGKNIPDILTSFGQQVNGRHGWRVRFLLEGIQGAGCKSRECVVHVQRVVWDVYQSTSGQPMCWAVVDCEPHTTISPFNTGQLRKAQKAIKGLVPMPFCCREKRRAARFEGEQIPFDVGMAACSCCGTQWAFDHRGEPARSRDHHEQLA